MIWWLLQTIAAGTILAAAVSIVCLTGRIGAVARHALWVLVLVKLLTPPLVVWPWAVEIPGPTTGQRVAGDQAFQQPLATKNQGLVATTKPAAAQPEHVSAFGKPRMWRWPAFADVSIALMLVWVAGSITVAAIQLLRIRRMIVCVRKASIATPPLQVRVDAIAASLAMRPVPIHVTDHLDSPVIWSMGRPRLLWPASWAGDGRDKEGADNQDKDGARDAFIVHELAHVKRRDHWVGWLELVCGIAWWWNPLYWYARAQVRENAELACDAWVAGTCRVARRAYAESLLAFYGRRSAAPTTLVVGAVSGDRRFLERRLAVIMSDRESIRLSRVGIVSVVLAAIMVLPALAPRQIAVLEASVIPPAPARPSATGLPAIHAAFAPASAQSPALPPDAQTLADRFARDQAEAIRQAEARIAQQRGKMIRQLQTLQDQHTRAGHLDEALAVRERIRQLQPSAPSDDTTAVVVDPANGKVTAVNHYPILPDPQTLTSLRDRVGETFYFTVTGRDDGTVWGDGRYTDDSALATAAVHAGILKPGQTGVVRVTINPGLSHYDALLRNGVQSRPYEEWYGSFQVADPTSPIEASQRGAPVRRKYFNVPVNIDATSLVDSTRLVTNGRTAAQTIESLLRDAPDATFMTVWVVGTTDGNAWGSDVYTSDSALGAAAVHAGVLRDGEEGFVAIRPLPGQSAYESTVRNGVTSQAWGEWGRSFRFERMGR